MENESAPERGRRRRRARVQRRSGYLDPDSFAEELIFIGELDRYGEKRLQIVSSADFREAVGPKWNKLSELVATATDQIIRRHLDVEQDIYTRLDAEIACLALRHGTRQKAQATVASIAKDIAAFLYGDLVVDGRRPQVVTANLSIPESVLEDETLNRPAIYSALAKAKAILIPRPTEAKKAEIKTVRKDDPHRATLAALLPTASEIRIGSGDTIRAHAVDGGMKQGEVATPDWFEEVLKEKDQEAKAAGKTMKPESTLTLAWTPTWVTRARAIVAYQASVIRADPEIAAPLEGIHAYRDAAPVEILTMDRFAATQAATELKEIFFGQHKAGLIVPVHWMSLAPRWCDCVRIPLEGCPPAARKKFLKVEVFGLTPSVKPMVLQNLFASLEKLGCDVMVRLPLNAIGMVSALRSIKAVGVDLAELGDDDRINDDELFARLNQFREVVRGAQMASYVWGARRRELIARIVRSGFSMVNGPGVMHEVSRPGSQTPIVKRVA